MRFRPPDRIRFVCVLFTHRIKRLLYFLGDDAIPVVPVSLSLEPVPACSGFYSKAPVNPKHREQPQDIPILSADLKCRAYVEGDLKPTAQSHRW